MSIAEPKGPRRAWSFLGLAEAMQSTSWKYELKLADLPKPAFSVVAKVVTDSRLSRVEKHEVAEELIAHFQDGLERGVSCETLVAEFGDPGITAQLIRNGKIRNRTMFAKIARISMISFIVALGGYGILAILFHMGKPTIAHDYLADLNAETALVDDDDRGWLVYRDAWTEYNFSDASNFSAIYGTNEAGEKYLLTPDDPSWDQCATKLGQWKGLLDAFRAGSKKPSFGLELQADPSEYSAADYAALFPTGAEPFENNVSETNPKVEAVLAGASYRISLMHLTRLREAAKLFTVDTRLALLQGETNRAAENICTIFGLSRHASESQFMVSALVGLVIHQEGVELLDEVLNQNDVVLNDDQLESIQLALNGCDLASYYDLKYEKLSMLDLLQRCYTDDGKGDGRITPTGFEIINNIPTYMSSSNEGGQAEDMLQQLVSPQSSRSVMAPASLLVLATREETINKMDALFAIAETEITAPWWEKDNATIEAELDPRNLKYMFIGTLFPAIQNVRVEILKAMAIHEAAIVGLAAHQFKNRHDAWPESLEQLIEAKLVPADVAFDPYDGNPMRAKINEEGQFIVYSIGNNLIDEGGVQSSNVSTEKGELKSTNHSLILGLTEDWVIWPVRN